jgi:lipopolysaccharide/colanic/teichoic acid biosynthesis glycosyltransferase
MYPNIFKPAIDFVAALILIICLSTLFLLVTVSLYFSNHGHTFFLQPRPGKNNKVFKIIKFKTMNDRRNKQGNLLPDAERLTAMGKFVRKTSLDEIPQLLNVIKGDMSLMGPARYWWNTYLYTINNKKGVMK